MIAESSPINYGVAKCEGEAGDPWLLDPDCPEYEDAGQDAWDAWFAPYFEHLKAHSNLKAICYINNDWGNGDYVDWRKNAQLGANSDVASLFRAEMAKPVFRQRNEVSDHCCPKRDRVYVHSSLS